MVVYVSVRGWLECDGSQLAAVKEIIAGNTDEHYSGGWGFPVRRFNWTSYVFYGGDVREESVSWLLDQLTEMAALPAEHDDFPKVQGLFMLTHEVEGLVEWQVRDGGVHVVPGGGSHQYLGN
ncbi:hypothetical protein CF54_23125 [Streptomyces sp. Tu 6176]|uniref:hypothetical protein n=1 Tax=Streptomyces sp. Tu 6176 TaxID=1470557 RepID=UPI00044FB416|nr:hypothetical protein [Streptomyces sp. Tu 6176]EYT80832.1 hypothetical protein CF54_23125 [Streptomyces sp. Tu 6176]